MNHEATHLAVKTSLKTSKKVLLLLVTVMFLVTIFNQFTVARLACFLDLKPDVPFSRRAVLLLVLKLIPLAIIGGVVVMRSNPENSSYSATRLGPGDARIQFLKACFISNKYPI